MVEVNEQWLDIGDCSVCRRQKYCSKPCKRARMRQQRELAAVVGRAMLKAMVGGYDKKEQ